MTSPQQTFSVSKKPQKQILSGMVDAVNNMLKDEDNYTLEESILVKAFDLKNDAVGLMYLMPNSYQYVFTPNQKELLQYTCRRIKFLLAVGAVPVVGVKDSPFDWEPTLKYGTDIDKITDNIIKEFELSKKQYPDGGDVWFAIPAIYTYTNDPNFEQQYKQLSRNHSGQTLEELTIEILEMLLTFPISVADILAKDDGTFTHDVKAQEKYLIHILTAVLQLACVVKKDEAELVKDVSWGETSKQEIENIIAQWRNTRKLPDIILALPKFIKEK